MRRFLALVLLGSGLAAGLCGVAASPAHAGKYASMVIDADSGRVYHARHADAQRYPASLTKMMTLFLLFDAIERGKLRLSQKLPVSARAARQPPTKLALRPGSSISVENAILALAVKSANDVAVVVAEALGGSEAGFARMMTKRARQLGMKRTTFRNASGLPHSGQVSTARDMTRLARAVMLHHKRYFHYFSRKSFRYGARTYATHNRLLRSYEGTTGIKTGYIRASGYNLVASATRNGRRLIGVVFGGRSSATRNKHMEELLDKGFALAGPGRPESHVQLARVSGRPEATLLPPPTKPGSTVAAVRKSVAPMPTKEATPEHDWGIQVGAFRHSEPAADEARRAKSLAPQLLATARPIVVQTYHDGATYFRARLVGLSKDDTRRACAALVRKKMRCMPVSPSGRIAMAVADG